jgi:hypothetical protein
MDDPLQVFEGVELLLSEGSEYITTENGYRIRLAVTRAGANLIPRNGRDIPCYVAINGIDLSQFGIIVNQCYNTALLPEPVKPPLSIGISAMNGLLVYPPAGSTYRSKQVIIECTMTADSLDGFYYNYSALFGHMAAQTAIELETEAGTVRCYYSNMTDFVKLAPFSRRVLVKFNLVLTCINRMHPKLLLADESRAFYITTENKYRIRV